MGDYRLSARERGYDAKWQRAAKAFKQRNPLCIGCQAMGMVEPATVVDHAEPHQGDQAKFWDQNNWQPACDWHHNAVKQRLEAMWAGGQIAIGDLRLGSIRAVEIAKQTPRKAARIGLDGWPVG